MLEAKSRKNLQRAISLPGNNHRRELNFAEISSEKKRKKKQNCKVCLLPLQDNNYEAQCKVKTLIN